LRHGGEEAGLDACHMNTLVRETPNEPASAARPQARSLQRGVRGSQIRYLYPSF
jgi:hypothetical protein